jgi:radical SAM family RiPP maturation amino acid epimerase
MVTLNSSPITKLGSLDINRLKELLDSSNASETNIFKNLSQQEFARELSRVAHAKVFLEMYRGDPEYRELVSTQPATALAKYNLNLELEEINPLLDRYWFNKETKNPFDCSLIERIEDFKQIINRNNSYSIEDAIANPAYKAWRRRQINRCNSQMAKSLHDSIGHFPIAFELSKGCSVGCWFCSVSAPRLEDIFFYTPENARLWREVLAMFQQTIGLATADSFCYWATDPLDNPDYEHFLCDFQTLLGKFPPITTAQALKNSDRTRGILKLSLEKGCKNNRFSIISLKMLRQIHQEFTPEELFLISLVQQHKEAAIPKANAGRMRERIKKYPNKKQQEVYDETLAGTNTCVTGFLVNMVDCTIKLISPCPASDIYPHGYRTYAEGSFNNANDLRNFVEQTIETYMPLSVRDEDMMRFRDDLQYESLDNGFKVFNRMFTLKLQNNPHLKQLGEIINQGNKTVKEIIDLFQILGVSSYQVRQSLNLMFDKGILDT